MKKLLLIAYLLLFFLACEKNEKKPVPTDNKDQNTPPTNTHVISTDKGKVFNIEIEFLEKTGNTSAKTSYKDYRLEVSIPEGTSMKLKSSDCKLMSQILSDNVEKLYVYNFSKKVKFESLTPINSLNLELVITTNTGPHLYEPGGPVRSYAFPNKDAEKKFNDGINISNLPFEITITADKEEVMHFRYNTICDKMWRNDQWKKYFITETPNHYTYSNKMMLSMNSIRDIIETHSSFECNWLRPK